MTSRRPPALLPLALLLLLTGCIQVGDFRSQPSEAPKARDETQASSRPQITLFLNDTDAGQTRAGVETRAELQSAEVLCAGRWTPLLAKPLAISSTQAAQGVLLGHGEVQAGICSAVRCRFDSVTLVEGGRRTALRVLAPETEFPLAKGVELREGDSVSFFLRWDVSASLAKSPDFIPAMRLTKQQVPLTSGLALASCPTLNTIYLIRTDQNRVCGSWGVPGRPTYLKAFKDRDLLYVLARDQGTIDVLSLSTGQIRDRFRVPLAADLSFMTIDQAGGNAFLLDRKTEAIYRLRLDSGSLAAQGRIGVRPDFAALLDDLGRLAVSSELSPDIFLLDPESLQVRQTIPAGGGPSGIISYQQRLYLAEAKAGSVGGIDLGGGAPLTQPVGLGPTRLLAYDRTIYAANTEGGSITALLPGQLTVMREIQVGGGPAEMAVSAEHNWLYANDIRGDGVVAVSITDRKLAARIELPARPLGLEVIP